MTDRSAPEFLELQRALIGRFSLVRELGRGGMGIVFLARDLALDRNVAIKLLPPQLATVPGCRQRFLREARLAAGLSHPHIVPIHLVDEVDDLVFFVMGYVEGETLGERIRRRGTLPAHEVARIVQQVAWALAHAHARGIVHRDVKPDNILLEHETGRALVSDFGIAGGEAVTPAEGSALGTPLYLSPEQAAGAAGDARSDVYALGVTAWYALTGRHPHEGTGLAGLLVARATSPVPALRTQRPDVALPLADTIDRALARVPDDRWPDAESLARDLEHSAPRAVVPPSIRQFVRTTMPLGTEVMASVTAGLSALGMMAFISRGGLIDAMFASAFALPIVALSACYGLIRVGQSATALLDLVREGYDHPTVARAILDEERELSLEYQARDSRRRNRDAAWYGLIGAGKTAVALLLAGSSLSQWVTVPAAMAAVIVPTLAVLKIWKIVDPGPGRWPGLVRGRLGRALMAAMRRMAGRPSARSRDHAPATTLLGGAIDDVFQALPEDARRTLAALPALARDLQREAERAIASGDANARARAATVAAALESLRVELLALQAGLRDVSDVTRYLDNARRVGERVDAVLVAPEITPVG